MLVTIMLCVIMLLVITMRAIMLVDHKQSAIMLSVIIYCGAR
jgi:hypothetical protein